MSTQAMTQQEVLEQARKPVNDVAAKARPRMVADDNAVAPNPTHQALLHSTTANTDIAFPMEAAKQHLDNAGNMYAKAAMCFEGRYQLEVLEHAMASGQQR